MTAMDMTTPNNNESGFKVVDRRRVDETGESRETTASVGPQQAEPSAEPVPHEEPKHDPASGPITFSLFIQSLAQQALMSMGLIAWPDTNEVRANFDHARETIDLLTIMQEKTKGNLTASEQRFLDSVIYELRMAFVEVLKGDRAP